MIEPIATNATTTAKHTVRIALVVGVVLTLINQGGVIASGHASTLM